MKHSGRFERHEALMNRMGDQNGADPVLSVQVGLLTPEEYNDAVLACTGCSAVEACESHLAVGEAGIPSYCRNEGTLRRLASEMETLGF